MKLSDVAYTHVKSMLIEGRVGQNVWLPVDEIAAELGSSRQPVMDAMKRLALEGFVEIVPQVGCRIRSTSSQEIDDFYRLFAAGEGLIAELCAVRADPSDIMNLQLMSQQIGLLGTIADQNDGIGEKYRILNRRLHAEMRRISRSPTLADIVESLGDRSDFYIALTNRSVFALNIGKAHEEHEAIIGAIARGDAEGAKKAMESHIFATEGRVLETAEEPANLRSTG